MMSLPTRRMGLLTVAIDVVFEVEIVQKLLIGAKSVRASCEGAQTTCKSVREKGLAAEAKVRRCALGLCITPSRATST